MDAPGLRAVLRMKKPVQTEIRYDILLEDPGGSSNYMPEDQKSRKNKKSHKPQLVFFLLLFFLIAAMLGTRWAVKYAPNREVMSEGELFGVSGEETAIMYNYEIQKATAICSDGQVYLPMNWVSSILNERFYWDDAEQKLIYALPDSIVTADENTEGTSGGKLLIVRDGKVYLSEALIKNYTDVRMDSFADGEVKRTFVEDTWGSFQTAKAGRKTQLRSGKTVKAKVIAEIAQGESLRFIPDRAGSSGNNTTESSTKWQRVMTQAGLTGYVQTDKLTAVQEGQDESTFKAPVYSCISMDQTVILAWHQITNSSANKYLDSVLAGTSGINVISPTWFALTDNSGNYNSYASRDYVDSAHQKGVKVWVLIDNFSKDVNMGTLLKTFAVRTGLIQNLMNDADTYGFDGINIDFEQVGKDASKAYVEFIRELSVSCRKKGLVLSVDTPSPASFNAYYDRKELGTVTDYVINMGYDEYTSGDERGMGSTASISFVQTGIKDCLKEVPKEKLINGVPLYTRVWTSSSDGITSQAMGIKDAENWVKTNNVKLTWNDDLGQYTGELPSADDKNTKYIWMEEEKSMGLKIDAVKEDKLAGVACWKLGLEPPEIWSVINEINK